MAETIGVISVKGGVGKTTTVANLAALLAKRFNKRVLAIDANFSAPNLGLHVGILNPDKTIHDVLNDTITIKESIRTHADGFDIIPASLNPKIINPYKLKNRLEQVKDDYDYILLDSSPSVSEEIMSTIIASNRLFVITSPDYPTLSCTMQAVKTAKRKNANIAGLIMTKVRNKKYELNVDDIQDATRVPVLGLVPHDFNTVQSLSDGIPASLSKPNSAFASSYAQLAGLIAGELVPSNMAQKLGAFFNQDIKRVEENVHKILQPGQANTLAELFED